ncbi:MAG: hypothetical protein ACTSVY_11980 [Candidatus Helarchaeota archaeon]
MANETNSKKIIFKYKQTENARLLIPILTLKIINPFKDDETDWMDAIVDTGYDGGLLVPLKTYMEAELNKIELPIDYWDVGESISGEITLLQAALALVKIKGMKKLIELKIETFNKNQEVIIGLNGIRNILLCLDGQKNELYINMDE